jgi:hypothetical protein
MTSTTFTEKHRVDLSSILSRTSSYSPTRRLLAVTTRATALGVPLAAVRNWLKALLEETDQMRDLVARDGAWYAAVKRSREVVELRSSRKGTEKVLEASVRRMLATALTPAFSSLVRGGGGAGNGKLTVKESDARAVCVLVAKRIVENVLGRGMDTVIVSQSLLHAQVAVAPIYTRLSTEWGIENRYLIQKMRSRSGAFTYGLRELRPQQQDALVEKADVIECLLAELSPGTEITGTELRYSSADPADHEPGATGNSMGLDELRMHRLSRRISRLNAMKDAEAGDNPFGDVLYGVWQPRGVLAGLEPALAAEVAADALWSVDSIVWRRTIMGDSMNSISWQEWLQLVADAVGVDGTTLGVKPTTAKKNRLLRAFPRLIERLNDGERFRDIVREAELKWEPQAILQERMAAWQQRSETAKKEKETFLTLSSHIEPVLDAVLARTGAIPASSAEVGVKDAWAVALRETLMAEPPPAAMRESVRRLLGRRIARRGYRSAEVEMVLDYALPTEEAADVDADAAEVPLEVTDDELAQLLI